MSEAGFTGFWDLQDFGIFRIERGRESEFPPTEESGLQTPPTRDTPIKESGLQTPPTEEITIPFPEEIHVDGGFSSLHLFLFLLLKQQKPGNLYASQSTV